MQARRDVGLKPTKDSSAPYYKPGFLPSWLTSPDGPNILISKNKGEVSMAGEVGEAEQG